jgi:Flp pilus assembly protein TadG
MQMMKDDKGQSMVEFALVIPLLLIILIGIIEFGFLFSSYLTLTNASREAVRVVSLGGTSTEAEARAKSVSGLLDKTKLNISVLPDNTSFDRGDSVEVMIKYEYHFLTPFMEVILGNDFELEANATMRVE